MSANPKTKPLRWFFFGVAVVVVPTITAIVVSLPPCFFSAWFDTKTTVLLVRHAEKGPMPDDSNDPVVNDKAQPLCEPLGADRARELVHVAGAAGVRVIYHTEYLRTQRTIGPLDDAIPNNTTQQFNKDDWGMLVEDIKQHHMGEVVLFAGHGDTVPRIIEGLGGPQQPDQIPYNEYDNLYVVTFTCSCGTRVTHLKYGRPSPLTETEARQCSGEN
jgi:phosphohistidine phosphatase SixA